MTGKFDFEQALEVLKAGKLITGKDSVLLPLIKRFSETDAEIIMLRGNESVPAGWVSRSFDVKVPATTVVVRNKIYGNAAFNVEIYLD